MEKIGFEQAFTMVRLQDNINRKVDPNWLSSGYPFMRGVLVEAVEALEHYGWKWWSNQPGDVSQVQIELIDILHFSLSHLISECGGNLHAAATALSSRSNPDLASCHFNGRDYPIHGCDVPQLLELLAAFAVSRRNYLPLLEVTFRACGLDWNGVMIRYLSKRVLSIFRQRKGYRDGRYLKVWGGREDNIHLAELVSLLDPAAANFSSQLYQRLEARYASSALKGNSCGQ